MEPDVSHFVLQFVSLVSIRAITATVWHRDTLPHSSRHREKRQGAEEEDPRSALGRLEPPQWYGGTGALGVGRPQHPLSSVGFDIF